MHALFATAICTGLRIEELLNIRWSEVDLARSRLTVLYAKTDAGIGREIDIWSELRLVLASYQSVARYPNTSDYVFATASGRTDTRSNIAKRLKRCVRYANDALAERNAALIPPELSPHSLRRTFASLLYMRGKSPVYVMHQMGHTDPKLALRTTQGSRQASADAAPAPGSSAYSTEHAGHRRTQRLGAGVPRRSLARLRSVIPLQAAGSG